MRLLVDSHALIWAVDDPDRLSPLARTTLQNPSHALLVSAATVWELAIKVGLRKLILSHPYGDWMEQALADLTATLLPITIESADMMAALPQHHRDPFDRLIIAQAQIECMAIVSADVQFGTYDVKRLW